MEETKIEWQKIWAIVAVQGTFTLTWVIYSLYLPDLLVQLGFSRSLAGIILIIENALEAIIEPISGSLSDRSFKNIGTREPLIKFGIILSSALFLILPLIGWFVSGNSFWRWILPILAVLWASAMALFRSPVMALLRLATPEAKLPIAASCITLVQQSIGAFRFTAYNAIVAVGPLFSFAIGTFVLLGTATFLRRVIPAVAPETKLTTLPNIPIRIVVNIIGSGIAIGFGLRFIFASLAGVLGIYGGDVGWGMLGFNLLVAGFAVPAGWLAYRFGNIKIVLLGLISTAILLKFISSIASIGFFIIATMIMSFTLSIVLNGMIPFVLESVSTTRAGLGVGLYFGAFGGGISFFDLFFKSIEEPGSIANLGAIALIIACLFVASSSIETKKID
ncbi:MAG: MFS transporter [Prochloraceae cyanobacterium]